MTSSPTPGSRPNILYIHSDQHRWDCLGAHGHPLLRTPHLDRLAAQGVDFQQACTPTPICTPARACLLTGKWPTQHGVTSIPRTEIYHPLAEDQPLLTRLLHDAGYRQAHIGKWHDETKGQPTGYGVDFFQWEEDDYDAWRLEQGLPLRERKNGWFGEVDPTTTIEQTRIAWGANHTLDQMSRFTKEGKPWFIRWDPSEPHLPNLIAPEMEDWYPVGDIEPWPSFPDPLNDKPPIQKQQRRTWGTDDWGWDKWAPIVSRYLAEIELIDRYVGQMMGRLDELGQAENTLIVYSTDHGDLCGGHGMMDKHFQLYDDVVRVPLLMRFPQQLPAGQINEAFISHEIDLATTFLAAAGVEVPECFEGVDLLPVGRGEADTGRQDCFVQYQGTQFGLYSQRMIRNREWKYVYNPTAQDELYHLASDPAELVNLAQRPAHTDMLMQLRGRAAEWMTSIEDPLLNEFTRPHFFVPGVKI
ncbi:MAG: sulfatase-like hydrolase/transferase [Planctomycetota bacterium]